MKSTLGRLVLISFLSLASCRDSTLNDSDEAQGHCPAPNSKTLSEASTNGTYLPDSEDLTFACGRQRLHKSGPTQAPEDGLAALQEFPFVVLLAYNIPFYGGKEKKMYYCSGTLINRKYVLTAASCMGGKRRHDPNSVVIGEYDQSKECDCDGGLCAPSPQEIAVENVIIHENYEEDCSLPVGTYDIALIRLAKEVDLNPGAGIACLPLKTADFPNRGLEGQEVTVVGWHSAEHNENFKTHPLWPIGFYTDIIQKRTVKVVKAKNWIADDQTCTGTGDDRFCFGDAGGPLLYRSDPDAPWFLLGVTVTGILRCDNYRSNGVYVPVKNYMEWIKTNLKP